MADVLRRLLDSGKLSDEKCHSILLGLGNLVDELYLPKNEEEVEGWTSEEEEELDEEYYRQVNESLGFDIDGNVCIPSYGISPVFLGDRKPCSEIALCGRLGVHCFNIEQGRKLQYMGIPKYNIQYSLAMSYYITVEVKDLADNSPHTFQTLVTVSRYRDQLRVYTEFCRIKPETPGEGCVSLLDDRAIDKFYKGSMPDFLSKAGTGDDKLRFYEVQEQDICEYDWLRLYTEFALFSFWRYNVDGFDSCLPVEIKKIVVETCETHREPRLKLKSSNAIFHINFSAKSCDYKSVVRRTMDGISGHIILEISSCRVDQPSSA
ncbi:UPF0725 protein At3g44770 [Capsella rubella]|uniref:UPF0725 protein At3g44770 n=1 Tax=Capsella rubella TaxID=81985 RepID=UPI000CD4BAE2|nr:UPF0725 protein At3g44770 [Capsella rubella]